jgi:hypothetical protein
MAGRGVNAGRSRWFPSGKLKWWYPTPSAREDGMRRRAFIAGLGGAATWPMVARGQQPKKVPRPGDGVA